MKFTLSIAAAAVLATTLVASYAHAEDSAPPAKKHLAAKKVKTPPPPSVADQIQALKQELEGQINGLKSDLAAKDAQLKQAKQRELLVLAGPRAEVVEAAAAQVQRAGGGAEDVGGQRD